MAGWGRPTSRCPVNQARPRPRRKVNPGAHSTRASASPPTSTIAPSRPPNERSSTSSANAEEDLAALAVFGCPHYERILAAYNEASPLEDGWRERVALHQMHIIMIHCAVFGRSYVPEAMAIARRYA